MKNELDQNVRRAIDMAIAFYQLTSKDKPKICGLSRSTFYRRMEHPENFTLKELRKMAESFGWDLPTIGQFFGR